MEKSKLIKTYVTYITEINIFTNMEKLYEIIFKNQFALLKKMLDMFNKTLETRTNENKSTNLTRKKTRFCTNDIVTK